MRPTLHRIALLIALPLATIAAWSCSSGGGGGSPTAPVIVSASFVGAGSTPVAGDGLVITVSKTSTLTGGALLTDTDFTLSDGSLGAVTAAPTLIDGQTIRVTLGAGVNLTPGTTTITFADEQDAVVSSDGVRGAAGTPRTITAGDGDAPTISLFTLNAIQAELNGTGAAGGTLQVPRSGFTIDVNYADASSALDANQAFISSSGNVSVSGANRAPGTDLRDALTVTTGTGSASFAVPASVVFADGAHTLTIIVSDVTGMRSGPATFSCTVRELSNNVRPTESAQVWYLDFSRDIDSYAITGTVTKTITITEAANAVPDFQDSLRLIGLNSATPLTNVVGSMNSNEVIVDLLQTRMLTALATLFSGVSVSFTLTSPGAFPSGQSSVSYGSLGFSQMCIAGASDSSVNGVLGSALFDPNNDTQNNNCLTDFGTSDTRLGVFPIAAVWVGIRSGATTDFRLTFDPFRSDLAGTPIGELTGDAARIVEVVNGTNAGSDPRITQMDSAITKWAQLLAVVTAHECGHSMGLVANDPMPAGLYGNDATNFPLSGSQPSSNANGHIQNTSLFPSGAQNIMSPAIDFEAAQSASTTFNSLNFAYLRERAIYVPN